MRRSSLLSTLCVAFALSLAVTPAFCARAGWKAGVAAVDITPEGPIWMAGYAARKHPSEGVEMPLHAKALALEDRSGRRVVIVTSDIIGFPRAVSDPIAEQVKTRYGLARDQIVFSASHIHSGPVIRASLTLMYGMNEEQAAAVRNYTEHLNQKVVEVVGAALKDLAPAELSLSRSEAAFAMNRRQRRNDRVILGVNETGPVDHEVTVLRVTRPDGTVRAVLFRYACHNTTIDQNYYRIHGDWAGVAQGQIEKAHPGATALFMVGCGADANPNPRGTPELAVQHGQEMARAIEQALAGKQAPVRGKLRMAFDHVDLPYASLPSREELQKLAQDKDVYRARNAQALLAQLSEKGKLPASYPYPVQILQFGKDLTMVMLAGEVLVDYSIRLKREAKAPEKLWISGYNNDVFAYIPSKRVLSEGGYEAVQSQVYYGHPNPWAPEIEDRVVGKVHELMKRVR